MPTPETDPRAAAWERCRDEFKEKPSPTGLGARYFFEAGWDARHADAAAWATSVRDAMECPRCAVVAGERDGARAERDRLAGRVRVLTEALEHYADPGIWQHEFADGVGRRRYYASVLHHDGDTVARAALADAPQEPTGG